MPFTELVGIYDADGGLLGEATYAWGRLRGSRHCSLCDITHSTWRRKPEWDAMAAGLPLPMRLLHRNELDEGLAAAAAEVGVPVVLARSGAAWTVIAREDELSSIEGSVERLGTLLRARLVDTPPAVRRPRTRVAPMTRAMTVLLTGLTALSLVVMAGCEDDERVPATPESLAAVALEHADVDPTLVEGSSDGDGISASIEFDDGQQRLRVGATDREPDATDQDCDDRGTCDVISTRAGDVELYWEDEEPEEDPGIVIVSFRPTTSENFAYYAGDAIARDPRDLDLGIDVDEMVAIVTDHRFGISTTTEMTEVDVPGWAEEPTELTPQAIAHNLTLIHQTVHKLAAYEVDASAYGDGSIGAVLELDDDITFTGYTWPTSRASSARTAGPAGRARREVLTGSPAARSTTSPPHHRWSCSSLSGRGGRRSVVVRDGPHVGGLRPDGVDGEDRWTDHRRRPGRCRGHRRDRRRSGRSADRSRSAVGRVLRPALGLSSQSCWRP